MDALDQKILSLLAQNARISIKEIAQAVNLTSPAVSARIHHMEEDHIIDGYTVVIHPPEAQTRVESLVSVSIKPQHAQEFLQFLHATPQVQQCYHVTGEFSHIIKLNCRDIPQLEHIISSLQHFGGTNSQVILSTPVQRPLHLE